MPDPRPAAPGYWMHETTGTLRPAVEAYLHHRPMTATEIAAMRAATVWFGAGVADLRRRIAALTTREAITAWLDDAISIGIDPL